jgi:hypothetical protein
MAKPRTQVNPLVCQVGRELTLRAKRAAYEDGLTMNAWLRGLVIRELEHRERDSVTQAATNGVILPAPRPAVPMAPRVQPETQADRQETRWRASPVPIQGRIWFVDGPAKRRP